MVIRFLRKLLVRFFPKLCRHWYWKLIMAPGDEVAIGKECLLCQVKTMFKRNDPTCPVFGTHQYFNVYDPDSCCFACGFQPWKKVSRVHHAYK